MNAVESNGVQNPHEVEMATLAGGLVALNATMNSMNQMIRFLCDRYVLDHFDYGFQDFVDYVSDKYGLNINLVNSPKLDRTTFLAFLDGDQLDATVFEFIKLSHDKNV